MPDNKSVNTRGNLPIVQSDQNDSKPQRKKSGRGRIRAAVLVLVHVVIALHIAHYWARGYSLSPLEPSEAMYTLELGYVNAGIILFVLAIISTVIWGRFFCGWGCHIVALQDLCGYVLRKLGLRPKPFRSRLLVWIPFVVAFYMFFWPTVKRLWRGAPHPGFSNHLMTDNFWQTFPGPSIALLTFVVCGGLIVYVLGNKGFCTYGCPYGAFFSVADRMAVGRIRVTDACRHCGQCTANCTSNVRVHAEVRDFGMVVDPGCMKCMDCVSVCPNDALYFGLTDKTKSTKSPAVEKHADRPKRQPKTYDFSITEELFGLVVAAATVYAMRGLYDGPAFLLSVALGVISGYLAIQLVRLFRVRDLRIQNLRLKNGGQITKTGWWTIVVLAAWFLFSAHSFFVQFHKYRGRDHLIRLAVTLPEIATEKRQKKFTDEDWVNVDKAFTSFQYSDQYGLMDVLEVKLGLAFTSMMKSDFDAAEKYLRQAYRLNPSAVHQTIVDFLLLRNRADEIDEFLADEP